MIWQHLLGKTKPKQKLAQNAQQAATELRKII